MTRPSRMIRPRWTSRTRLVAALREERGNTSVLTIGVMVIVLMVIAFGAAITGVELDRNRVQAMADGAALSAAAAVDEDAVEAFNAGYRAPGQTRSKLISQDSAEQAVEDYLASYPAGGGSLGRVEVESVEVHPSGDVTVRMVAETSPPLVGWISRGLDAPVTLRVESEAHSF